MTRTRAMGADLLMVKRPLSNHILSSVPSSIAQIVAKKPHIVKTRIYPLLQPMSNWQGKFGINWQSYPPCWAGARPLAAAGLFSISALKSHILSRLVGTSGSMAPDLRPHTRRYCTKFPTKFDKRSSANKSFTRLNLRRGCVLLGAKKCWGH